MLTLSVNVRCLRFAHPAEALAGLEAWRLEGLEALEAWRLGGLGCVGIPLLFFQLRIL